MSNPIIQISSNNNSVNVTNPSDNIVDVTANDANSVNVTNTDKKIVITDKGKQTTVNTVQEVTKTVQVNTIGPQGPAGPAGSAGNFDSSALLTTASFNEFTSSYYSDSASFNSRINNISNGNIDVSGYTTTSSFNTFTSSYKQDSSSFNVKIDNLTNVTSSYLLNSQTSSFVTNNQTSSFIVNNQTASFVLINQTGSMLSPYLLSSQTESFIISSQTSSFVTNSQTSSFVQNSQTASISVLSASYAATTSFAPDYVLNSATGSMLMLYVLNSQTASFVITSSFNLFTGSYQADSSSFNNRINSLTNVTNSFVQNSQTGSFATTGSNTFIGNQIIDGNLTIYHDLTVLGSASFIYITSSQLNVGTNIISVNVAEPAVRFGGLVVYDSGSLSHQATASFLWDSQNNHFIYQNASGSTYSGGMIMSGPRNTGSLGEERAPIKDYILKGQGGDHLVESSIFDNGIKVSISSSVDITGSLNFLNGGVTGSLYGTASWAHNYNETDPVFSSKEGSLVTTSSFNIYTGSVNSQITSLTSQTSSYVQNNQTSSFVLNSQTASFIQNSQTSSLTVLSSSFAFTASYISPTFISASAAASGFGSGTGGGSTTLIDTIGFRVYTDDTFITSGLKSYKHIAYDSNIIKTRSIANTNGYIDINVKRNGSTLGTISLSNQSASLDTTLTGWTTTLNTDDLLEFHVSQSSTYITDISIFIDIQSQ